MRVVIEGMSELEAALRTMGKEAERMTREATEAGAEVEKDAANRAAPGPHVIWEVESSTETKTVIAIGFHKDHWYYRFFELGAGPHEIKGRPLHWVAENDQDVYATLVKHPGMTARPFLRNTFRSQRGSIVDRMGKVFKQSVERAAR